MFRNLTLLSYCIAATTQCICYMQPVEPLMLALCTNSHFINTFEPKCSYDLSWACQYSPWQLQGMGMPGNYILLLSRRGWCVTPFFDWTGELKDVQIVHLEDKNLCLVPGVQMQWLVNGKT